MNIFCFCVFFIFFFYSRLLLTTQHCVNWAQMRSFSLIFKRNPYLFAANHELKIFSSAFFGSNVKFSFWIVCIFRAHPSNTKFIIIFLIFLWLLLRFSYFGIHFFFFDYILPFNLIYVLVSLTNFSVYFLIFRFARWQSNGKTIWFRCVDVCISTSQSLFNHSHFSI